MVTLHIVAGFVLGVVAMAVFHRRDLAHSYLRDCIKRSEERGYRKGYCDGLSIANKIPSARPTSAPSRPASGADESQPSSALSSGVERSDKQ